MLFPGEVQAGLASCRLRAGEGWHRVEEAGGRKAEVWVSPGACHNIAAVVAEQEVAAVQGRLPAVTLR